MSRLEKTSQFLFQFKTLVFLAILSPLIIIFIYIENPYNFITEFGHFFPLGLIGAIAANSTGAGGGIVFIPAFTSLGIEGNNALGTSLAIQCFGMTAGSISWLLSIHRHQHGGENAIQLTHRLLIISGIASISGMLIAQYFLPPQHGKSQPFLNTSQLHSV